MKLPAIVKIRRETVAPSGWYAYYVDLASKVISVLPLVLWVTVEYDEEGGTVQEIRPFVLARSGRVLDAHEPESEFLCIYGPDIDHTAGLKRVLLERHPELHFDKEISADVN